MIHLTKLNGKGFVLNSALIETIEASPDTSITTTTGRKLVVMESVDDIINRTVEYQKKIYYNAVQEKYIVK